MTNGSMQRQIKVFLDKEFAARKGYSNPKVIFRAKDVIAGSLSIRQITRNIPKRHIAKVHGQRREMGKVLSCISTGSSHGYIEGYRLIVLDSPDAAKGAKYMAVLRGSSYDQSNPINSDVAESE